MTSNAIEQHREARQEALKAERRKKIISFLMKADFNRADTRYLDKHGYLTAPILNNETEEDVNLKGVFRFIPRNISPSQAYWTHLSPTQIFLPTEEADYQIHRCVDNFNKNNDDENFGTLKLVGKPHYTHGDKSVFWTYLSDRKHQVQKGDTIRFGLNFRNGIGTGISLGGDLFSYRLACLNGAVVKDKKFGSFNIPHRISVDRMLEKLTDGLVDTLSRYKKLLEYYKAFSVTKLTDNLLREIVKKAEIPLKVLNPGLVDITMPSEENTLKHAYIKLTKRGKDSTLWDLFNSITDPYTRRIETTNKKEKLDYFSFVDRTSALHRTMFQIVKVPQILQVGSRR